MLPMAAWGWAARWEAEGNGFPGSTSTDLVGALLFLLDREGLDGPFKPLFAKFPFETASWPKLWAALFHRPAFLRAPGFLIRLVLGHSGCHPAGPENGSPAIARSGAIRSAARTWKTRWPKF